MTNGPTISVLVTVYNRESYLAGCLESILASTWRDFEVVVVDDCSTDGSLTVAQCYASLDSRIRVSQNDRHLGDYPNRGRAAELATGRFLKYVDSDDLIYPHSLAIMMEAMQAHRDATLALSHSLPEDEEPYPVRLSPSDAWRRHFLGRGCLSCGPSGAIMSRAAFVQVGGFRDWGVLSDLDLWYRLSATAPVLLLAPGLVWWRRHAGQESKKHDSEAVYLAKGHELNLEFLRWTGAPLGETERRAAMARAKQHHARRLLSWALRRGDPLTAYRLYRESGLCASELGRGWKRYQ